MLLGFFSAKTGTVCFWLLLLFYKDYLNNLDIWLCCILSRVWYWKYLEGFALFLRVLLSLMSGLFRKRFRSFQRLFWSFFQRFPKEGSGDVRKLVGCIQSNWFYLYLMISLGGLCSCQHIVCSSHPCMVALFLGGYLLSLCSLWWKGGPKFSEGLIESYPSLIFSLSYYIEGLDRLLVISKVPNYFGGYLKFLEGLVRDCTWRPGKSANFLLYYLSRDGEGLNEMFSLSPTGLYF